MNKEERKNLDQLYKTKLFRDNEIMANKRMAGSLLFIAIFMSSLLTLYFTGLIKNSGFSNKVFLYAILASDTAMIVVGYILSKTKLVESSNFKYFLIILMIFVIGALNMVLPKHGILAWALCILFASAYHSKLAQIVTIVGTQVAMLLCLYGGAKYGEWDLNLFNVSQSTAAEFLGLDPSTVLTGEQRIEYLIQADRVVGLIGYYYVPRALVLGLLSLVCYGVSLNNRVMLTQASDVATSSEKTASELNIAANIQLSALPSAFPHNEHFDLYASMHPAKAVGGDFYDFFQINEDYFAFLIADVSGKGVPAAMFMMKAKTLIKTLAQSEMDPAEVMTVANKELCEGNDQDMFVTCWFAGVNIKTGEVRYVNAGHNPILLKHKTGSFQYLGGKPQFVLGGYDTFKFKSESLKLLPGDEILVYTDGCTEALNNKSEFYGEQAFLEAANACGVHNGKIMIEHLNKSLTTFANGADQADDITVLLFRFFGTTRREITIPAKYESTQQILDFVEEYLMSHNFPMKVVMQVNIVIDEIYSNIAKFAYTKENNGNCTVVMDMIDDKTFSLTFTDNGEPFNPLEREDPDINLSADDRDIGGLGIFIVKKTMDTVEYAYKDGLNILSMTKNIEEQKEEKPVTAKVGD